MILNENLRLKTGDGAGETQGEHLEPNSPVFPRPRLLHNLPYLKNITSHMGRAKGLDVLFGGEHSFPLPF